jgi:pyridoxamine 5'-phosphate oxidase
LRKNKYSTIMDSERAIIEKGLYTSAIRFSDENPICFFTTLEGDQPRVRAMGFWFSDETGFYFQSGSAKELVKHIGINPKVEVIFYKPGDRSGRTLRIAGKAEFVEDEQLKKRCIEERPFLKQTGIGYKDSHLVILRIPKGNLHFWNWDQNLEPKFYVAF